MSDYNSTATSTIYVNGKAAEAELQKLKSRASDLRDAIAKAAKAGEKASLKKLRSELNYTRREVEQVESAMHAAEVVMKRLDKATPKELQMTLKQLKKELNNMERGTKAWDQQTAKIKQVKAELTKVNTDLKEHESLMSRVKNTCNGWGMAVAAAAASLTGLTMTIRQAVSAYADMDQEMANVQKYTGMGKDQVAALNDEFKKMDTRTPREGLNQLAQEAGKLGKTSQEDIMGFVRAADKINVALDELGDGATLTLSKLTGVFGDEERLGTERSLLAVGSVINELSQNSRASAPYLAEFASRLGGIGSQAGMTIQQVMGFGAVLDSAGQQVESSATALGQVVTRLYKDPAKYAKAAGMDVQQFTDLLKTDANAAVIQFLETLNQAGNLDVLAPMFADMGENGARAIATLTTLAKHIDEVKQQQQAANVAFSEASSIDQEFDVQNNTVAAGLEKAKNAFNEMAVTLGEKLVPVARYAISGTSAMMHALSGVIDFAIRYKGAIIALVGTLVTYTLAVNAQTIALKVMYAWEALCKGGTMALTAVQGVAKVASYALAAAYNFLTGNMTRAAAASRALKVAMASTGWGAIIAVVGTLTAAVYGLAASFDKASSAQKALNQVQTDAQVKAVEQRQKIESLIAAAGDFTIGIDNQRKALAQLNKIIPGFNGKIDAQGKKFSYAKGKLDSYINSLIRLYEVEGAKKMLIQLGEQKARAVAGMNEAERQYDDLSRIQRERNSGTAGWWRQILQAGNTNTPDPYSMEVTGDYVQLQGALSRVNSYRDEIARIERQEQAIRDYYGKDLELQATSAPDVEHSDIGGGGGGGGGGSHRGGGGGGGSRGGGGGSSAATNIFAGEEKWRKEQEHSLKTQYTNHQIDLEDYTIGMLKIELEFYEKQLQNAKATADQKLEIASSYEDAARKLKDFYNKIDVDEEEKTYKEQVANLKQRYIDGELDQEKYHEESERLEKEHYTNLAVIYRRQASVGEAIWAENQLAARKALSELGGNADLVGSTPIDSYLLTQAGYSGFASKAGESTVNMYARQYTVKGADKKKHDILVTPILPDGTVLSKKDLDDYVNKTLAGSSDFLSADSRGLIVKLDAQKDDIQRIEGYVSDLLIAKPEQDADLISKAVEAETKVRDIIITNLEEQRHKDEQEREEHLEKLKELKDEYFGLNDQEKQELYDNTVKLLDEVYQQELAKLGDNEKAKLELEKKYAEAKKKLHDKIFEDEEKSNKDRKRNWEEWTQYILDKLFGKGTWEKFGGFITSAFGSLMSSYQSITKLVEAEEQQKLNAMTKKYDAEIKAAEGNKQRIAQLERKKKQEEKRIKDAANRRAMAMEMAQAMSSNALGAINAYASAAKAPWPLGMVLGPIAAGLALAAGAIQIAAIQKQHAAQAAGYAHGGFTRPGEKYEPAGIVHAGEWVASQELLASPVARPVIEMLDRAQRTNTIGRLASTSSSRARRAAGAAAAAPVVLTESPELRAVIARLAQRLDEPFVTVNTVSGDNGIKRAIDDYNKLQNNTLPKNKRT